MSFTDAVKKTPVDKRKELIVEERRRRAQLNQAFYVALPVEHQNSSEEDTPTDFSDWSVFGSYPLKIWWQIGLPGPVMTDWNMHVTRRRMLASLRHAIHNADTLVFTTDDEEVAEDLTFALNQARILRVDQSQDKGR